MGDRWLSPAQGLLFGVALGLALWFGALTAMLALWRSLGWAG